MFKLRTFIILIIVYVISYISIGLNINLLYPYYYIKDIIIYPVRALNDDKDLVVNNELNISHYKELENDIHELKELMNIKNILSDYNNIYASILERNRTYWFNSITIDKGKNDGIDVNMAVISKDGLIGKINKVGPYTSEIKLITTNDINNKISVVIENNEKIYGITSGYESNNNCLLVTLTTKNTEVKKDSLVKTTGMGGIFPSGILIGKVDSYENDINDIFTIVKVKLQANFNELKYVSVLSRI